MSSSISQVVKKSPAMRPVEDLRTPEEVEEALEHARRNLSRKLIDDIHNTDPKDLSGPQRRVYELRLKLRQLCEMWDPNWSEKIRV